MWATTYTGTFTKITSTSDFTTGYYVVAASESASSNAGYALGNSVNSDKRMPGVSVTITNNNTTISDPNDAIVWYITVSGTTITMQNVNNSKYLYQASTTSGKGMGLKNDSQNLTLAGYNSNSPIGFKFTLNGNSNNYFKYNASNKWFANYANDYTTSVTPVRLFKLQRATPPTIGGTESFEGSQDVTITAGTGATIYYTTDGTTPTTSSTVYSGAIHITTSCTIKAIASETGKALSQVASKTFTNTAMVATPVITLADGPFVSSKNVTITCATDGASISYSTDNGNNWNEYSTPFAISATTTVQAKATKSGMTDSNIATETFTKETVLNGIVALNAAANGTYYVSFTDAQFTFVNSKNGYLNDANAGIYYYNNTAPTLKKTYNGIYRVVKTTFDTNMPGLTSIEEIDGESTTTTADDVQDPTVLSVSTLDEDFGDYLARQIQINDYTVTNASKLTENIAFNTTYYNPSLTVGSTYRLVGYPYNSQGNKQFRITAAAIKPVAPTFDPVEGEFSVAFTLHLACATAGSTIYYTTDGTDPTTGSTEYVDATGIAISAANTTVKAIAVKDGMQSDIASATYTYKSVAKPLFGITSGTAVYYGTKVEVTCTTAESSIFYTLTTDGSEPADPTSASTAYPDGGIAINANTVKIKVIAKKGDDYSSIASATYTLKAPEAPTFSPAAGAVARNTFVTISSAAGTSIMYTTDGSDADTGTDTGSNSVEVSITAGMTLKAIAYDPELNISSEASAAYTIAQVATPSISVPSGEVVEGTTVTIDCQTADATIHYTTDGTDPTASSATYSAPISIDADMTIKAIAVKENYVDSEVASATYSVLSAIPGLAINFEANKLSQYVDWTMNNIGIHTSGITAHGGSAWGSNINSSGNGVTSASITTHNKIAYPGTFTCYISKESKNTTDSSWKIQVSNNGSDWTDVASKSAKEMAKGEWQNFAADLTAYTNVYVRLSYSGSDAIRAVDDITLTLRPVDPVDNGDNTITLTTSDNMDGWRAFYDASQDYELDEDTKAYVVTAKSGTEGEVELTKLAVTAIPHGEAVILKTSAANHQMVLTETTGVTSLGTNLLAVTNGTDNVDGYRLGYGEISGSNTVGFFKYTTTTAPAAGIVYIDKSNVNVAAGARGLTISCDDDATAIETVKSEKANNEYFNLAGQRVANPTKGLYIVNGRKVVVK